MKARLTALMLAVTLVVFSCAPAPRHAQGAYPRPPALPATVGPPWSPAPSPQGPRPGV
jgi:hypothetical protein